MTLINLSLDHKCFGQKPSPSDAALITSRIALLQVNLDLQELAKALSFGRTYCPGVFKDGSRKASKWLSQQVFTADIDGGNLQIEDINNLINNFFIKPSIIHESFSSTDSCRKWRLIFVAEKPTEDPKLALAILKSIQVHFNSDPAIVDLARLLYGTTVDKIHLVSDNIFNWSDIPLEDVLQSLDNKVLSGSSTYNKPLPDKSKITAKSKIVLAAAKRKIIFGNDSRYQTVWHTTRLLSQTGFFSETLITSEIKAACKASRKYEDYDKDINEIIKNALQWGAAHQWDE